MSERNALIPSLFWPGVSYDLPHDNYHTCRRARNRPALAPVHCRLTSKQQHCPAGLPSAELELWPRCTKLNKLPVQEHIVHIGRLQHKEEQYLAVFPLGNIPCLKEGEWMLPKSAAILRYLATQNKGRIADHWYPGEPHARATVEAAMDWHHGNLRKGSAMLVWHHVLAPLIKQKGNAALAEYSEVVLLQSLEALETFWLKNTNFVAGNQISIADLLLCTELSGLRLIDGAVKGKDIDAWLQPFPRVVSWMAAVRDDTLPVYDDVHVVMNRAAEHSKQRSAAASSKF